jgi:hypothetical protein
MTQAKIIAAAAVAALTFGITSEAPMPFEHPAPIAEQDILVVENQSVPAGSQSKENADEWARMGKDEGTYSGEDHNVTPENDSDKIDQAARRNPTTSNEGASSNQQQ